MRTRDVLSLIPGTVDPTEVVDRRRRGKAADGGVVRARLALLLARRLTTATAISTS